MLHMTDLTTWLWLDPLFRWPLWAGLCAGVVLPVLGVLLQARREWLAALGVSHVSAAAQLLGTVWHWGLWAVMGFSTLLAVAVQALLLRRGNMGYALMMLLGWSAVYVLAANSAVGESFAHALSDGQLLLVSPALVGLLLGASLLLLVLLPAWVRVLVAHEFFPLNDALNRSSFKRWQAAFYAVTALLLTVSAATMGLMASFALVLVAPLVAFRVCTSLSAALWCAAGIGGLAEWVSFVLSVQYDQPFGGVVVALLLLLWGLVEGVASLRERHRTQRQHP
jgi:zinc/manganese transport system permease protein